MEYNPYKNIVSVVTEGMGSCQCGNCYCSVYRDGTVQYEGLEDWQQSERREFLGKEEPHRMYGSQLNQKAYERAMEAFPPVTHQ